MKTIRTLARSIREYRRASLLTPLLVGFEVMLEVAITYLMADMIDLGINAGDMGFILRMGLLLALAALVSMLFGALAGRYAAEASAGFAANLRRDIFRRIQSFSFSNIDGFSTGSLITRLTTDVTHIQQSYMMIIRTAVRSPMMLILSMLMAFRINARISKVFLFSAPLLLVGIYLIFSKAHPLFMKSFKAYDRLNNVVQENLSGIRVVKAFVQEKAEQGKFEDASGRIFALMSGAQKVIAFNMPLMQLCIYGCMLAASWLGANIIVEGGMTTGDLMSVLTYAMSILMSLMMLSMVFMMIVLSRASAERISEVLNTESSIKGPCADGGSPTVEDGGIEFRNVSFSYYGEGGRLCLEGIDLSIAPGETIGVIGGTGSGKSTLVQLIPRLYDAVEGEVLVGGRNVREYPLKELRSAVSMVLQKNQLFTGTVAENLRWGDGSACLEELQSAARVACAEEFILRMEGGYDAHIERGGANLSGGQRQRMCIARALIKKPRILILDDSTSAVDTATDASIRRALREQLPGTTKLIIAQRISSVQDADRIVVMDNGRILACDTHEALIAGCHVYREIYESQQKGGDFDE